MDDSPSESDAPTEISVDAPSDSTPDVPDPTVMRYWQLVAATPRPVPVYSAGLAYHASRRTVILYGGFEAADIPNASMWEYDGSWTRLCSPCPPGPLAGHALLYDEARLVLIGGADDQSWETNEHWEWDGTVWMQRTFATMPPPHFQAFVTYDRTRRVIVLFGGQAGGVPTDHTFEFDGTRWTEPMRPTPRPPARAGSSSSATYDSVLRASVIYGGRDDGGQYLDDAWAWDGTAWTQLCAGCTGEGRAHSPLGYDPASGRLILVGGFSDAGERTGTWEYDTAFRLVASTTPSARDSMALTFDMGRDVFVLFGGDGACDVMPDHCDETLEYRRIP